MNNPMTANADLRGLVQKWRAIAHELRYNPAAMPFSALRVEDCADDLEQALAALSVAQGQGWEAVPEHVRKLIGQIDCYRLRMSYNESYFGEPAGLLKGVFAELGHAANPIYPSGKTALYPGLPAAPAQPDGVE